MRHRTSGPITGPETQGRRSRRAARIIATSAAGGLLLAFAVACTGPSMNTSSAAPSSAAAAAGSSAAGGSASAGPAAPGPPPAGSSASASPGKGGKPPNVSAGIDAADRQVIRTASVTLNLAVKSANKGAALDQQAEVDAVSAAFDRVSALANGAGYVSAASGRGATMSVTLRIPNAGYASAMDQLKGIAAIVSLQESTQDVTSQMIDISSRLATMTASVNRVRTLLSKADKIGDVIAIESELTSREADLESLQRQQAGLAGQTSLSTITVVIQSSITGVKDVVAAAPPAARSGFIGGLAIGWGAVRTVGHAGLTVLGTLIPFLPLFAVVIIAVLIWRRRVRRIAVPVPAGDPHSAD